MSNIFRYIIAQLRKNYLDDNTTNQQALPVTNRIESNPHVCDCCDERWPRDQVTRTTPATPLPTRFSKSTATLQSV
jgi:hypothetical protein